MNMKRTIGVGVAFLGFATLVIGLDQEGWEQKAAAHARPAVAGEVPVFQVDPSWPKIPNNWVLGQVPSVSVDAQDHVWILQRPGSLKPEDTSRAAPPVLEFDAAGNFLRGWGGPGEGYEWPESEHGLYVDHKGYIWIGGNTPVDNHVLKFTQDGKFVLQIGRKGQRPWQQGHEESEPADGHVRLPRDERTVRRRWVRQQTRDRVPMRTVARSSECGARSATRQRIRRLLRPVRTRLRRRLS